MDDTLLGGYWQTGNMPAREFSAMRPTEIERVQRNCSTMTYPAFRRQHPSYSPVKIGDEMTKVAQ
jgi:hypothetical protein